jgi:Ca2+/H+ antiporter, TMEM165/GDT1 family
LAPQSVRGSGRGCRAIVSSVRSPSCVPVEAFLVSTGIVALAEIGDKTQLLALVLAARFRRPGPICLGILFATLLNHAGAAAIGAWAGDFLQGPYGRWGLALSFFAVSVWALIPDKLEDETVGKRRAGAFLTTLVCFFLVEIGDKTQIATVALAATYEATVAVVVGTTLGMMIANVPAVLIGERAATRLPLKLIRGFAAAAFAGLGVFVLLA